MFLVRLVMSLPLRRGILTTSMCQGWLTRPRVASPWHTVGNCGDQAGALSLRPINRTVASDGKGLCVAFQSPMKESPPAQRRGGC
jgi:hypothetical protein